MSNQLSDVLLYLSGLLAGAGLVLVVIAAWWWPIRRSVAYWDKRWTELSARMVVLEIGQRVTSRALAYTAYHYGYSDEFDEQLVDEPRYADDERTVSYYPTESSR